MEGWLRVAGPWLLQVSRQTGLKESRPLGPASPSEPLFITVLCSQSSIEETWGTFPAPRGQPLLGQLRGHPCKGCGPCSECSQWLCVGWAKGLGSAAALASMSPFLSSFRLWRSCLLVASLCSSSWKSPLGPQGPGCLPWARPG